MMVQLISFYQNRLFFCGGKRGCLLGLIILFSSQIAAQEAQVIFDGLVNATSIYATQDHLFVVESGKHRLLKLDHDGNLIERLGGLGTGDYQFDRPIDVDATNGLKIYISDYGNNRIQIYDRRFQYLGTITGETAFRDRRIQPTQLVVNNFGELFVYDGSSKSILKFDENGNYIDFFKVNRFQVDQMRIRNDSIQLVDNSNLKIQLITQNGILGEIFPFQVLPVELVDKTESSGFYFELDSDKIEKGKLVDQ